MEIPAQRQTTENLLYLRTKAYASMIISGMEATDRYLALTEEERKLAVQPEQDPIYLDCVAALNLAEARLSSIDM